MVAPHGETLPDAGAIAAGDGLRRGELGFEWCGDVRGVVRGEIFGELAYGETGDLPPFGDGDIPCGIGDREEGGMAKYFFGCNSSTKGWPWW